MSWSERMLQLVQRRITEEANGLRGPRSEAEYFRWIDVETWLFERLLRG